MFYTFYPICRVHFFLSYGICMINVFEETFYGIHHLYHSCILLSNKQSQKNSKIHSNLCCSTFMPCRGARHFIQKYGNNNNNRLSTQ